MKNGLELRKVVLLGRTFEEYVRYFGINEEKLRGTAVLDIASGVSSFCSQARERGINAIAFDLIYDLSPDEIRTRCEPDLDFVVAAIGKVKAYRWDFYKSPEGMRSYREKAYKKFLEDYAVHRNNRYVCGKLPMLPFENGHFDLTLASYLLFVYEDQEPFDYEFHKKSLLEMMRVTKGEARIYPLVNFKAERCSFVDRFKEDSDLKGFAFEEIKTDFEFLAGSNAYLKILHRS